MFDWHKEIRSPICFQVLIFQILPSQSPSWVNLQENLILNIGSCDYNYYFYVNLSCKWPIGLKHVERWHILSWSWQTNRIFIGSVELHCIDNQIVAPYEVHKEIVLKYICIVPRLNDWDTAHRSLWSDIIICGCCYKYNLKNLSLNAEILILDVQNTNCLGGQILW